MKIRGNRRALRVMGTVCALAAVAACTLTASASAAVVRGTDGPDALRGTPANDIFHGQKSSDTMRGHGGHDYMRPGNGNDAVFGGAGNDVIMMPWGEREDFVHCGRGTDVVYARVQRTISHKLLHCERVVWFTTFTKGTAAGETINGAATGDRIMGFGGIDIINGGDGDDVLEGGGQGDTLDGGLGDDLLWPGNDKKPDTVTCGDGNDTVMALDNDVVAGDCENIVIFDIAAVDRIPGEGPEPGGGPVDNLADGTVGMCYQRKLGGNFETVTVPIDTAVRMAEIASKSKKDDDRAIVDIPENGCRSL